MIPLQGLVLEHECDDDCEYRQGNDFLDYLELHQTERAAVVDEAYPVGRHLGAVFEEGYTPGEKYHKDERPAGRNLHFLKLEVAVPCECHEDIGCNKEQYCAQCFHHHVCPILFGAAKIVFLRLNPIDKLQNTSYFCLS